MPYPILCGLCRLTDISTCLFELLTVGFELLHSIQLLARCSVTSCCPQQWLVDAGALSAVLFVDLAPFISSPPSTLPCFRNKKIGLCHDDKLETKCFFYTIKTSCITLPLLVVSTTTSSMSRYLFLLLLSWPLLLLFFFFCFAFVCMN